MPPGTVIGHRYRIDATIARGGMGIVYRGWHLMLEQQIAIKVMRPELVHWPGAGSRFMSEARAMAQLRGNHAVRVLDTGNVGEDSPYLVLEYLHGCDLRAVLEAQGPQPVGKAVGYVLEACEGLAEAHALGIVHRDIKPGNLFLSRSPDGTQVLKIIDFGISKRMNSGRSDADRGHCLGSPQYMPPEQMTSPDTVDARADIWSLGVLLYELLAGTVPFGRAPSFSTCCRVLRAEPAPLRELRGDLPLELQEVVLGCLRKRVEERVATVRELAEALAPFGVGSEPSVDSATRVRSIFGSLASTLNDPAALEVQPAEPMEGETHASEGPRAGDLNRTLPGPSCPPPRHLVPSVSPAIAAA
jgi:eukaryotic-like serine/threonine-protein kinase